MKLLKKQKLYMLTVHHNDTLQGALLWWLLHKNKHCWKFCPLCNCYFRCQEDVAAEKIMEGK